MSLFIEQSKNTALLERPADISNAALSEWLKLHHDLKLKIKAEPASGLCLLQTSNAPNTVPARTYFYLSDRQGSAKPLRQGHGFYLYKLEQTDSATVGKTAAKSGSPILGDTKNGGTAFQRLCLHCGKLNEAESPWPDSFDALLQGKSRLVLSTMVAVEKRGTLLDSVTNAYRIVHRGEVQKLPFAVDRYGGWLCITGFDEELPSSELYRKIKPAIDYLRERFNCRGGIVKTNLKDPHKRKLFADLARFGEPPPELYYVQEHGLKYGVTLNDDQHTGLFLDQRDSRRRVALSAKGRRIANLFSFTCSFSSAAVAAEAEVAFSVDLAGGCLDRGKTNFSESGLAELNRGKFIKEDVRKWLARQGRRKANDPSAFPAWDLIVCDPPVFASAGKGQTFHVEREWPDLAAEIAHILSKDGIALFANNHRGGSDAYYQQVLEDHFENVQQLMPPLDFPQLPDTQTHVRIYWCEKPRTA